MPRSERLLVLVSLVLIVAFGFDIALALRDRARRAALREDLTRFALAQESYYYDHKVYGAEVAALSARGFRPEGAVIDIHEATRLGWSALATFPGSTIRCTVHVKDAAPIGMIEGRRSVWCR